METKRRDFIKTCALGVFAAASYPAISAESQEIKEVPSSDKKYQGGISPWQLILNTSTIRPATLQDKIRVASETKWDGIEPWSSELEDYEKQGGNLKDLGKQIKDLGLIVPNVIGLWESMPDGEDTFKASLEATRNRMRMASDIGSIHVAAIPAPDRENIDLKWCSRCYKELLKIGEEEYGIRVAIEFVGFFKGVHRFGQACAIAIDADDPRACIIADTFHLFRGDSGFSGIELVQGKLIAHFHWNDVPGDVPREKQGDEHRLYPGDGILPLKNTIKVLKKIGYTGCLSLELFNREHWKQDPKIVAENGLKKMQECVQGAGV
ncbi:MAG TPA: sugar phosphate isomerase/epimerase [Candidatus Hydrogenedens sp.]|nr:sugar phosphate isomerase/epimerase [Candidatus Hydrogenedens sp.]